MNLSEFHNPGMHLMCLKTTSDATSRWNASNIFSDRLKVPLECSRVKCSVVEQSAVGVHQSDAMLVAGVDHNLVCSRTRRGRDVLDTALQWHGGGRDIKSAERGRQLANASSRVFTRLARSMLSRKGKKASELTATACRELIQLFFSTSDRSSGTSSYIAFQTAKSGP